MSGTPDNEKQDGAKEEVEYVPVEFVEVGYRPGETLAEKIGRYIGYVVIGLLAVAATIFEILDRIFW